MNYRLIHISDLHIGRAKLTVLASLADAIKKLQSDFVVVSGDLTHRAKKNEFLLARQFLDGLKTPCLVVPGNHDIPFYNLLERYLIPKNRFASYIGTNYTNYSITKDIAILGIDTSRSMGIMGGGRITKKHRIEISDFFSKYPKKAKILVCHHPLKNPAKILNPLKTRGTKKVKNLLLKLKIDIILSGHLHHANIIGGFHPKKDILSPIIINAPSATIKHWGRAKFAFFVLDFRENYLDISYFLWHAQENQFKHSDTFYFKKNDSGWEKISI